MKYLQIIILFIPIASEAFENTITGKVIGSSCEVHSKNDHELGREGEKYILIFDLHSNQAHIFIGNDNKITFPQATIDFKNKTGEYYLEANGGVENHERFHDVFDYLSNANLKFFNSYNESVKYLKKNTQGCDINYSRLKKYLKRESRTSQN